MKRVAASDYYEVRKMGTVPSTAFHSLSDLYLPLVGPFAVSVYQCLVHDPSIESPNAVYPHGNLFAKLQMTSGQFESAMKPLEAVGLIKTFVKESENGSYFVYCLYAPLMPEEFLSDILFRGMLVSYIGEKEVKALEKKYATPSLPTNMEECSESFVDYFHPDFNSGAFSKTEPKRRHAAVKTDFDKNAFLKRLAELGITNHQLVTEDFQRIEKLGTLYDLSSETIAEFAFDSYQNGRLNMANLESRCSEALRFQYLRRGSGRKSGVNSSSKLAQKIRLLDEISPSRWLTILQDGHKAEKGDLLLLDTLSHEYGLPDPCINVLIEYASYTSNGRLVPSYCEKIAASMVREGCETARDAMDFLKRTKKRNSQAFFEEPEKRIDKKNNEGSEEEVSDEEMKKLLADL